MPRPGQHDPKQTITVRVKPGSKKGPLVQLGMDGHLLVYVREPALDGKANAAVIKLLADYYDVPKSNVEIIRGYTTTTKTIKISA